MSLSPQFPSLPEPLSGRWSPNIRAAHATLCSIYEHAAQVLDQEDSDPIRVSFHIDTLSSDGLSILEALEAEGDHNPDECLPEDWLHNCASILGDLVVHLYHVKEAVGGQYVSVAYSSDSVLTGSILVIMKTSVFLNLSKSCLVGNVAALTKRSVLISYMKQCQAPGNSRNKRSQIFWVSIEILYICI
jgi:hypothetical protein